MRSSWMSVPPGGGSDDFKVPPSVTVIKGRSSIEPGRVPARNLTLTFKSFTNAANSAGLSRRYDGIHFEQGDLNGRTLGAQMEVGLGQGPGLLQRHRDRAVAVPLGGTGGVQVQAVGQVAQGDRGPAAQGPGGGGRGLWLVTDRAAGKGGVGQVAGVADGQLAGDGIEHRRWLLSATLLR
jgi:hypothetical protein